MHVRDLIGLMVLLAVPSIAIAQSDDFGQVILENRTGLGAELYVDEEYHCYAPPHGSCMAEVPGGPHLATIRFDDGDFILSDPFDLPPGMSVTLPVRDLMT